MVNFSQKFEILSDLIFALLEPISEQQIIEKTTPLYLRKLNCFVACILKQKKGKFEEKYILPHVFNKIGYWKRIKDKIIDFQDDLDSGNSEIEIDNNFFYGFRLAKYGVLILGRKTKFDPLFRHELNPVVSFFGKSLIQSIEREQLESSKKNLARERNLLKTIINNIPVEIYANDINNNKILTNHSKFDPQKPSEEINKNNKSYIGIDNKMITEEDLSILKGSHVLINEERAYYDNDDNKKWVLVSKLPLREEDNSINGLVGITIDISASKKNEELLLKKQKIVNGIALATDELLTNSNLEEAINNSIQAFGSALELTKIDIYDANANKSNKIVYSKKYEWFTNKTFSSNFDLAINEITNNYLEEILPKTKKKDVRIIVVNDVKNKLLKETFITSKIKSIATIPVFIKNECWGFISFYKSIKDKNWSNDEILSIKSFNNSLASAIEIYKTSNELKDMALFPQENPDPVIRIDRYGKVLLKNIPAEKFYEFNDFPNKGISEKDLYKELSTKLSEENRSESIEITNGQLFYQVKGILSKNKEYINLYYTNITERKIIENAILDSNNQLQLFQSLMNNSSDAVQVSLESGQLFYINNIACDRLGIDQNKVSDYYVQDFEEIFQNPQIWEAHLNDLKNNDYLSLEGTNINQKTNQSFPVEVTVNYIKIAGIGYVVANSRDITNRKKNEKHLRLQEEKYRNIISNMNLGLLEVDLDDKIQFCNNAFESISGYEFEEIAGKKASDLLISDENKNILERVNQHRISGISNGYEILTKNKRGDAMWWLISGAPNYNDIGEVIGTIGIHLDITEQKKLEVDLERALTEAKDASEAKELFLANMSHEIRTPLNGVIGMIRELNNNEILDAQKLYLKSAKKASNHLLSVVNNILDITKIESGELHINAKHFSINQLLEDVIAILLSQSVDRQIDLSMQIAPNVPAAIIGDEARIRQILINVAGNAIKFTENGYVTINCNVEIHKHLGEVINFTIQDTGIGMNESYLSNLFKKFHQEDASISRKFGGSGLGLFITKKLVDLMNGSIEVTSKKGLGTKVNVYLPLEIGDLRKVEQNLILESTNNLSDVRILLVEDNEMNRLVAINTLKSINAKIVEATNGVEAIELLKDAVFDIILMDIQMPLMNGIEATEIIRNKYKINTPIIALSANAFKSEIDACIAIGMNDYLTKPYEEQDLIRIISKHFKQYSNITSKDKTKDFNPNLDDNEVLYNLHKLTKMSSGDQGFIAKMLKIFVTTIPSELDKMQLQFKEKKYLEIGRIAHKIKPSIDHLDIDSMKVRIRDIESFSLQNNSVKSLEILIKDSIKILTLVVDQINKNELQD